MKAIIDPIVILGELKKVAPVVPKNAIVPAVQSIKLDFGKKSLQITGTDMNTWVVLDASAECKVPFSICVPYGEFFKICSKSAGPLLIEKKEATIMFTHDNSKVELPISVSPEDYPKIKEVEYLNTISVDCDFFFALSGAYACRSTISAMTQLVNPAIDFQKEKVTVIGTDANILYKKDFSIQCKTEMVAPVFPEFVNLVKGFQDSTISISEKYIKAESGNMSVHSRLSENKFVDYKWLLPAIVETNFSARRKDIINAISIVDVAANKETKEVLFIFSDRTIVRSCDPDYNRNAETELWGESSVEIDSIRLNGDLLVSVLNTVEGDIKIAFSKKDKAVFMIPDQDPDVLLLIMPLFN